MSCVYALTTVSACVRVYCAHAHSHAHHQFTHHHSHRDSTVSLVSQFCILVIICNHNSNLATIAKSCFTSLATLLNRLHQKSTIYHPKIILLEHLVFWFPIVIDFSEFFSNYEFFGLKTLWVYLPPLFFIMNL